METTLPRWSTSVALQTSSDTRYTDVQYAQIICAHSVIVLAISTRRFFPVYFLTLAPSFILFSNFVICYICGVAICVIKCGSSDSNGSIVLDRIELLRTKFVEGDPLVHMCFAYRIIHTHTRRSSWVSLSLTCLGKLFVSPSSFCRSPCQTSVLTGVDPHSDEYCPFTHRAIQHMCDLQIVRYPYSYSLHNSELWA